MAGFTGAYEHNGDRPLLDELGLKTGEWPLSEWVDVGTVTLQGVQPREGGEGDIPATTIRCEVMCTPAQFWRFTITRHVDGVFENDEPWPSEWLEVRTGSGSFCEYWAAAKLVAFHMFDVVAHGG